METNNIDTQIKNQLEQRTLEPSAKSWEQLRSKLDNKDKKNQTTFWWVGIAASFVGGILLVSVLYNKPEANTQHQVTESPPEKIIETNENLLTEETIQTQEALAQEEKIPLDKMNSKKASQSLIKEKAEDEVFTQNNQEAQLENLENLPQNLEEALVETQENLKTTKAAEDEVDALLEQAMAKIYSRKTKTMEAVSANQLLEVVEEEVERSFRERVFEILKDGFKQSKEALANRNQ